MTAYTRGSKNNVKISSANSATSGSELHFHVEKRKIRPTSFQGLPYELYPLSNQAWHGPGNNLEVISRKIPRVLCFSSHNQYRTKTASDKGLDANITCIPRATPRHRTRNCQNKGAKKKTDLHVRTARAHKDHRRQERHEVERRVHDGYEEGERLEEVFSSSSSSSSSGVEGGGSTDVMPQSQPGSAASRLKSVG